MSLAVLLSGIPQRAGLDSAGRGLGYNIRARIDPLQARHEGDIYLDVARALGLDTADCYANVPVSQADIEAVRQMLGAQGIAAPYIVVNPAGGRNPGMTMDIKRWPPLQLAELARRLAQRYGANLVVIGGPQDTELVDAVQALLRPMPSASFPGVFTFPQLGALAREALVYIGNDTGVTHYAAAAGGKTVMILGPSDPVRYAPFTPDSLALWKFSSLPSGGVASGAPQDWDWVRDGISVDEAESKIINWLSTFNSQKKTKADR